MPQGGMLSSSPRQSTPRAALTGDFTLRSSQVSDEYFDKYRFESDPVLLRAMAELMLPLMPEGTGLLGGLELGGIPIVTDAQLADRHTRWVCSTSERKFIV